jgi:hypothetical protein
LGQVALVVLLVQVEHLVQQVHLARFQYLAVAEVEVQMEQV